MAEPVSKKPKLAPTTIAATPSSSASLSADPSIAFLATMPYFTLIPPALLDGVQLLPVSYDPGQTILNQGLKPEFVCIIQDGHVEVFEKDRRVGEIVEGAYFGGFNTILDTKTPFVYKAGPLGTRILKMSGSVFLRMIRDCTPFAQAIGRRIHEKEDLFVYFRRFCHAVFEAQKDEFLEIPELLECYHKLETSIHSGMNGSEIDTSGWGYAVARLPHNVTSSFVYDLIQSLPPFIASTLREMNAKSYALEPAALASAKSPMLASPAIFSPGVGGAAGVDWSATSPLRGHFSDSLGITPVTHSEYRRRVAWQLMTGKTLVLMRDGYTDVLDICTCLCTHIIEARKLRGRLQGMIAPAPIVKLLQTVDFSQPETPEKQEAFLSKLPLSNGERLGLRNIWPKDLLRRIYEIVMHREEYLIRLDNTKARYFDVIPGIEWVMNIRRAILRQILGLAETDQLPQNMVVDIVSANAYGVPYCLSPVARQYSQAILTFGKKNHPAIVNEAWKSDDDLLYALLPLWIKTEEGAKVWRHWTLVEGPKNGVLHVPDTAMTGLHVVLVDMEKLSLTNIDQMLHSMLKERSCEDPSSASKRHLLVNLDFAFGAQGDGILRSLISLFGHRIRSVNIMGKAGGLVGKRGDIQLASHVLFSKSGVTGDVTDELRPCGNLDLPAERLRSLCGRTVHEGPVLTIAGTLLQSNKLLCFYRRIWKCIGVEMEGSYYIRQVEESIATGLLSPRTVTRVAYYTSDIPLKLNEGPLEGNGEVQSLAAGMTPLEGIPPQYAIMRAFLELIIPL